jgi:predicted ATPase
MQQFFGGSIKFEREQEYVETADGRKLPFSILSSGQQELLPLWMAIEYFVSDLTERNLVFIEEPEAHLFPSAQALLTRCLVPGFDGLDRR